MDDGRSLLAELQQSDWVDGDLDYDTVMAGLAAGRPAAAMVARDRHRASFMVQMSVRESELLAQLTAQARAPYVSASWPDPPEVDLAALEADFLRTTARRLALTLRFESYPDNGLWVCDITIDGTPVGASGVRDADEDPGERLASLADNLCEYILHEAVWGGWPMCPRHRTRPMWAKADDGIAWWVCEADAVDRRRIGELGV